MKRWLAAITVCALLVILAYSAYRINQTEAQLDKIEAQINAEYPEYVPYVQKHR